MKGIVRFTVQTRTERFQIELCSKYTLFVGDSGSYKTRLHNSILRSVSNQKNLKKFGFDIEADQTYFCSIKTDYPVVAITKMTIAAVPLLKGSIVIIDENVSRISKGSFAEITKNSDCYFIFINRKFVRQYPINMNSLFELKEDSDSIIRNYLYYPELQFENLKKTYFGDILLSEDRKSGRVLLEKIYFKGIDTLNGKDSVSIRLRNDELDNSIVFADAAAFAQVIINLEEDFRKHNVQFILYQSIEWLMLHAEEFEGIKDILKNPSEFIDSGEYNSWEKYFTNLFILLCKRYFNGYDYNKSGLPKQILSDTNLNIFREIMPKILPLDITNKLVYDETNMFF